MIPRLVPFSSASSCAVFQVTVLFAVLLPNRVQSFFHNQENVIAPINSAGLLINQLLVNTANVSSLLDRNLDHIKRQVGDYPAIEERSDYYPRYTHEEEIEDADDDDQYQEDDEYLGSDSAYHYGPRPRPHMIDGYHSINMYRTRSHPRRFRHKVTTTGIDTNLPFGRHNRGRGLPEGATAVFPGTNWCGYGTTTMNQQMDLGVFQMTDFCCKIHDKCPFFIRPGQKRYHLVNNGLYTRSHCKCDRDFYRCLKRANTLISNKIGRAYFNVLGPQCFQEAAPVVGCKKSYGNRCQSYAFDRAFPGRIVQWFDNPMF